MQVVSFGSIAQLSPADQSIALTRAANNWLAEAIATNPDRLSGFAVLPWQDPQAAAAELDRSVNELGIKGVLLIGRPGPRSSTTQGTRPCRRSSASRRHAAAQRHRRVPDRGSGWRLP
jgi:predicted TIM-barrel fold metal-dependent hydrolase